EVKIDARQDSIQVETDYYKAQRVGDHNWKNNGKLVVEYHLTVPRTAVLDEIETVNGGINISNAANMTKASAVNGEVRAINLRGTANLSTVNGTVQADFDQLQTGSRISLDTVNGTVDLIIPSDANATLKADTVNGSITNDFGLPVHKGQFVGKDMYGRIGSGDVQIKLNSVNGGLSIKRKNDGRNVNPATNLLPTKSKMDDDFNKQIDQDVDEDTDADKKIDAKEAKARQKENLKKLADSKEIIVGAMKQAQKEIANLQIDKITADALREANAAGYYFAGSPAIEKKSDSFAVVGIPTVTIQAKGCNVAVRGWDKQEVQYSVVKIAGSRIQTPLDVKTNQNASNIDIKIMNAGGAARRGDFSDDSARARVEIFVPKKSNLKIENDGEIRLEGVSGTIDLRGTDGAINVRDGDGLLTVNGGGARIRIVGFRGEVESRTLDGSMFLEGGFQRLLAETSNGAIVLNLPENTNANFTSNRKINFEGINPSVKGEKNWRVGNGGANYFLQSADGEIFVRPASVIKTN
ncbi:MAG: DUF4097 family beta strand repeat-containing protein, partial [Acidobacteriota bacterium]|nr:DUF4097 family beta strand repeat-containing protein [Acidobacteriota bacterium]